MESAHSTNATTFVFEDNESKYLVNTKEGHSQSFSANHMKEIKMCVSTCLIFAREGTKSISSSLEQKKTKLLTTYDLTSEFPKTTTLKGEIDPQQAAIMNQVADLLEKGLIRPSTSS